MAFAYYLFMLKKFTHIMVLTFAILSFGGVSYAVPKKAAARPVARKAASKPSVKPSTKPVAAKPKSKPTTRKAAVTAKKSPQKILVPAKKTGPKPAVRPVSQKQNQKPKEKAKPKTKPSLQAKPQSKPTPPKPAPKANLDSYGVYVLNTNTIKGHKDLLQPLTLSSVSKIFVTYWALRARGVDFTYSVKVHITPIANRPGVYNVHLSSDNHPNFDMRVFKKITAYLKGRGISNIDTLSYDEGVKFIIDSQGEYAICGDHPLNYPSNEAVSANLKYAVRNLNVDQVKFFASRSLDQAHGWQPVTGVTKTAVFHSSKMEDILHSMNSTSNNFIANQIFNSLGGASAFEKFAAKGFRPKPGQLVMYNGSGNPIHNPEKRYNVGTAKHVLMALGGIHVQMKFNNGIKHVLALAAPSEENTLRGFYAQSQLLRGRMVAKTGTTWDAITLAGELSTKQGPVLFYYNIDVNSKSRGQNKTDASGGRTEIRNYLNRMMEALGPGPKF